MRLKPGDVIVSTRPDWDIERLITECRSTGYTWEYPDIPNKDREAILNFMQHRAQCILSYDVPEDGSECTFTVAKEAGKASPPGRTSGSESSPRDAVRRPPTGPAGSAHVSSLAVAGFQARDLPTTRPDTGPASSIRRSGRDGGFSYAAWF